MGLSLLAALAALAPTGCSSETPVISMELTLGQEADAMSRDPAVTRVDVRATSLEGDVLLTTSAAPGETFDLGEVPRDRLYVFDATGVDATGAAVVQGRTLSLDFSGVTGGAFPLFVQRTGEWARPPGGLPNAHVDAPAGVIGEQFLFTTGGTAAAGAEGMADPTSSDSYDLVTYGAATSEAMPRVARSLVTRTSMALVLAEDGATVADFTDGSFAEVALPAGLTSFADIAGGRVVEASAGVSFVVGATRADVPTTAVLAVAADGSVSAHQLSGARAGAAAVYVPTVGLVVAGGSDTAAGVEVLADGATTFTPRPFPPDGVTGAGAVVLSGAQVALLGGVLGGAAAKTRTLDASCPTACTAQEVDAPLPVAMRGMVAYGIGVGRAIAVGSEAGADAMTRSFLFDVAIPEVVELPLREPRRGATPVVAPNGTLAILGGVHPDGTPALSVETWFPR